MDFEDIKYEDIGSRNVISSAGSLASSNDNKPIKPKVRRLLGESIEYTPKKLQNVGMAWIESCEEEFVTVSLSKTNVVTGEALEIKRPKPPLIESFCSFANITYDQFSRYREATKRMKSIDKDDALFFERICSDIHDYCVSKILEYVMVGWIDEGAGKFYITNNSRYQNSAKFQLTVDVADQPAWLKGVTTEKIDN